MSPTLDKLWGHGRATIQDASKNAAQYAARYGAKAPKDLPEHLRSYPEFNTASKLLGVKEMLVNIDTYLQTDEIWCEGRKHNIPDVVLRKHFGEEPEQRNANPVYRALKAARVAKALANEKSMLSKYANAGADKSDLLRLRVEHDMRLLQDNQYRAENKKNRLTKNPHL